MLKANKKGKDMKNFKFVLMSNWLLLTVFAVLSVNGQTEPQTERQNPQFNQQRRPNLLQALGLTQEQRQQIRRINADKKPLMLEAQIRLRQANRNLDQAIYAETLSENEIQNLVKEVQKAQAEVIRIRSATELAVRKILTPEQLSKFREIRQKFAERMEDRQENIKKRISEMPDNRRKN